MLAAALLPSAPWHRSSADGDKPASGGLHLGNVDMEVMWSPGSVRAITWDAKRYVGSLTRRLPGRGADGPLIRDEWRRMPMGHAANTTISRPLTAPGSKYMRA